MTKASNRGWIAARLAGWFELAEPGKADRFASMEGLRGLAIFLVFCAHYYDIIWRDLRPHSAALSTLGEGMMGAGGTGVDLFFVLSGFLIYGAVRKPALNLRRFLTRRAWRIYPAFLAVFLFYMVLSPFLHVVQDSSGRYSNRIPGTPAEAALYLVANVAFLPGIFSVKPVMNVAWSLSYEWFFYLSLPLVILALGLDRWPRRMRFTFFLVGALVFLAANLAIPETFYFPAIPGRQSHVHAVMFAGGILLYEAVEARVASLWNARLVDAAGLILGAGAVIAGAVFGIEELRITPPDPRISQFEAWLSAALFPGYSALVFAALTSGTLIGRLFSARPLRWLGNMSFSFYLVHGLPLHVFGIAAARLGAGHLAGAALWVVFAAAFPFVFLGTALCSAFLFLLVEKPLSLARPARSRPVAVSATAAVG